MAREQVAQATTAEWIELMVLEGDYCATFDSRQSDAWSKLFSQDGVYEPRGFGREADVTEGIQGRPALASFCETFPYAGVLHILGVPSIRIRENVAQSRINFTAVLTEDTSRIRSSRVTHGYYDVSYVRTDGEWLIQHRTSHATVRTEIQTGEESSPLLWQ